MSDNCCNLDFTIDESLNIPMAISGANYNEPYELPTMSTTLKGGAKVGEGLAINEDEQLYIEDGAITSAKLDDGAVTAAKIADGAVTADKFDDGAIGTDKFADGAVTNAKINDGAVSIDKLSDEALTFINDAGMYALDIRNKIVGTIELPATTAYMQVHTIINNVLYYAYTYNSNTCYLCKVPYDFSSEPVLLETFASTHPTCMGSVNANTLVISYPGGFIMYDIANNTYTTKTISTIWGFTVDRKTDDSSVHPDLLVAYTAMNTGIARYGHTDEYKYQPVFYINPSSVSGHLQDTASYDNWVFQLLIGAPGIKTSNGEKPYRYNYLYVFNANTGNPLFFAPIICNYEVEGITVRSLGANGDATLVISDVVGNVYEIRAKLQPNSVSGMFPGFITKKPIVRLNTNNTTSVAVTDTDSVTRTIFTQIKLADRLVDQIFANNYEPYLINGGARCRMYLASPLNAVYTIATNGTYMAYNRDGTTNTYNLASIYNSGSNVNATYNATNNTINKKFSDVRVTGNSSLSGIVGEGHFLPDISFD